LILVLLIVLGILFVLPTVTAITPAVDACRDIDANGTWELTGNVASNFSCFHITADNVTLNCHGFEIRYDLNGSSSINAIQAAVNVSGFQNVTIQDCLINDGNANGTNAHGILINQTGNVTIKNNTIALNGSTRADGVRVLSSAYVEILNNTINAFGSSSNNLGVNVLESSFGINITENTINTRGQAGNIGVRLQSDGNLVLRNLINTTGFNSGNTGIRVDTNADNQNITSNTILTNGTSSNRGIALFTSANNTIANNVIRVNGNASLNPGIEFSSADHNIISGNNISANGTTASDGITLSASDNNTFTRNRFVEINSSASFAIDAINGDNNTFTDTVFLSSNGWMRIENVTTARPMHYNFTNITLQTVNGSIRFPDTVVFKPTGSANFTIDTTVINITNNRALVKIIMHRSGSSDIFNTHPPI